MCFLDLEQHLVPSAATILIFTINSWRVGYLLFGSLLFNSNFSILDESGGKK
jgi:hypothetical protein